MAKAAGGLGDGEPLSLLNITTAPINTIQLFVNADYPSVSANNCPERYPLFRYRFRSRTPGPPPFSSMIST